MSNQPNDQGGNQIPDYGTAPERASGQYPGQSDHPGEPAGPGSGPAYPSYPAQAMQYAYPEASQTVLAFVLGVIGLVVIQLVAPFAWVISNRELRGIDAGRRDPSNRGLAVAGKVMGIIGTVLLAIGVVVLVLAIILVVAASTSSSS
ncbi:MAG TPA: DUF4190 domain-containing protein [Kineosporiaceae bacterium]|nr:DUF4190 domain-containing protein [Kineosporiaceae bacterium]